MFRKILPILIIFFVVAVVFRKFFLEGLLPIPGDLLIGAYYPWLDSKWGFPTGVPVKNPLPADVISLLYPWRVLGMEMVKSGQLPLWDQTILLGTPLLANFQAALLNPFNILFLIMPSSLAWSVQVILQPLLIASATFLFLKNLGLQKLAAVFGGLSFAFSGFSIVWMEYNTIGFALFYFPLTLLLIDKIIQNRRIIFTFLLGLALAFQLFSGYPQISIYTVIFSGIYFIFRLYETKTQKINKSLLFILGIGSAAAFAAIQLLPSYELLQLSIRSVDNTALNAGIQFFPLTHLITLLIPDFFGNPVTANYWLGSYDNFAFSLPAVSVFLALLALVSKIIFKKENTVFLIFIILSLLLALDNPLGRLVSQSDYLGLKSAVAARVLFVFDFALATVAAFGFNELLLKKKFKLITILVAFLIFVLIVGLALAIHKLTSDSYMMVAIRNSALPLFSVVLATVVLLFSRLWKVGILVILGVFLFNIFTSTDKYLSFVSSKLLFPQTEVINTLQDKLEGHRFDREKGEIFSSNTWIPYGLKAASGQNALYPLSTSKYLSLVNGYYPNKIFRFVDVTGVESPLYDTLDIKYLTVLKRKNKMGLDISGEPLVKFSNAKFKGVAEIGTVKILENSSNLGFAWFSENVKCSSSEKEIATVLKQSNYNPQDLMIVNCPNGEDVENANRGEIKVADNLPGNIKLLVNNSAVNYLNLSQASYPGWKAFLNGRETPIYTSNLALTAVKVLPGDYTLEFKYQPRSFTFGWQISLATLVLWLFYFSGFAVFEKCKK